MNDIRETVLEDLSKFQKLSELEHVLKRPGIYIGAIANTEADNWVVQENRMVRETVPYNPGLLKLFDEIISNSVDEHIRSGKVKNIWVETYPMTGEIVVRDDGGIPVQRHPELGTYIPEMIFGELRTGSNFDDDDRSTAGTNGLGSKLTSIFSKEFKVDTCDGKNRFVQTFRNNLSERGEAVIQKSKENGTTITFTPDYERFECEMDEGNLKKIERRVYDVAGCNPKINVYYNGERIRINKFSEYVGLYTENFVIEEQDDWTVAVASSDDAFQQVSFVNGIDTYNGGTHVEYVSGTICGKLRELIKKKHKVDVRPNIIKQQLFLFVKCRINAPSFTSQTKEFMSTEVRNFGTSFDCNDKFIKKIMESDVVQKVLDWVEGEKRRAELAELRKLNKTTQNNNFLKRIVKFDDATTKNREEALLFLTEGDSAASAVLSARDPKLVGVFPLKGKLLNVRDIEVKRLANNEEFQNIMAIIGLRIGHEVKDPKELRFGKIVLCTDQDPDGSHISGLLFNMLNEFWPELFGFGIVHKLNTPLIEVKEGKQELEFFNSLAYQEYAAKGKKHTMQYHKGLGGFETKHFKRFLSDLPRYMVRLTMPDQADKNALDIAFDKKKANDRKEWLLEG